MNAADLMNLSEADKEAGRQAEYAYRRGVHHTICLLEDIVQKTPITAEVIKGLEEIASEMRYDEESSYFAYVDELLAKAVAKGII